jgi:hypothetical protein
MILYPFCQRTWLKTAVRRTALDETILYPSCQRTWLKTAVRTVPNSCDSSAKNSGQLPDRREPTVAIAVRRRRTALDETILYPSCQRTWLKTAVRTVPNSCESSAKNSGQLPDRREPTVAIAVRRTAVAIAVRRNGCCCCFCCCC